MRSLQQKGSLHHLLRCFVVCQLVSTTRKASLFVCAGVSKTKHDDRPPRYWPRYSGTRKVRLLDGIWEASLLESQNRVELYGKTDSDSDSNTNTPNRFDSMDPDIDISKINTTQRVTVPSTIEVIADPETGYLPGYMGYRGVAFFRTHFETKHAVGRSTPPSGPGARIQFQACSFYCRVWLNGIEIGDHIGGGYVAWWLDIPQHVLNLGQEQVPKQKIPKLSSTTREDEGEVTVTTHELFVLVDNRFNSTTAPLHTGGDFWHYGGIMRSVEWHDRPDLPFHESTEVKAKSIGGNVTSSRVHKRGLTKDPHQQLSSLSNVWPWRLYVVPQKDIRSVELSLQLVEGEDDDKRNRTDADLLKELRQNDRIRIYFDGNVTKNALNHFNYLRTAKRAHSDAAYDSTESINPTRKPNTRVLRLGIFWVPNPRIWSTSDPQLHTVSVNLNGAIVTERFGLRIWDTGTASKESVGQRKDINTSTATHASGSIMTRLNGKLIKLMGWNHHTQWPYTAASPTDEQLDEDIRLLKESGHANFVRGAHYPQDPRWLDRLDEHGMVVWCETLGPSVSVANLQDDYFLKAQNQQINEMLDSAFNHASVAFWGFFNEGPSNHEEAYQGYKASSDAIKARDTSRFITYASNHRPPNDKCYGVATVISYNGYPGWYDSREPEEYWNSLASDLHSGIYPCALGKPILISETGAGGIFEWKHNRTAAKWTLGYQADVVSRDVATAIKNVNISGIALWHFFDFKVNDRWENNTHCDYQPGILPKTCGYIDVESSGRPGGANHKGSLDFFRRPKPIFSIVASQYDDMMSPDI